VTSFLGRYEHQMDDKGHVALPSAFRREADGSGFVLLQWEKPYLTLFPLEVWQEIQGRLVAFRKSNPEGWNHVRQIVAGAVEVSVDKQGRILIPAWLQEAATLEGTVLLNGNLDRVEIWDPRTYADTVQAASGDALARVAHSIFS
jgi:MraZ protein